MKKKVLELSEKFRNRAIDRRTFIQRVVLAAGGVAAAGEALKKLGFDPGLIREARASDECEIVTEDLTYPSGTDTVNAYLARPAQDGPFPTMIVIHEIFGLSEFTKAVARLFACNGYLALAPELPECCGVCSRTASMLSGCWTRLKPASPGSRTTSR
jgi:carboxymethylenebutenolidase